MDLASAKWQPFCLSINVLTPALYWETLDYNIHKQLIIRIVIAIIYSNAIIDILVSR